MSRTPCSSSFFGSGMLDDLRHAGVALGSAAAEHEHRVGVDVEVRVVDPSVEVLDGVEDQGPTAVAQQVRRGSCRLDERAVGGEVAAEHRDAGLGDRAAPTWAGSPRVPDRSVFEVLDQGPAGDRDAAGSNRSRDLAQAPPTTRRRGENRPSGSGQPAAGPPAAARREPVRSKSSSARSIAEPAGDRQQVNHGVGRTADRGQRDDRVEEGAAVRNVLGRRSAATISTASRPVSWAASSSRLSGAGVPAIAGQIMPERLGDHRHRRRGTHRVAVPAAADHRRLRPQ